jgi:arsenate reductase
LFVCIGNACRSIMAEAIMRHYWGDACRIDSAGIAPLGRVPDNTIEVLEEVGIATCGLRSKGLHEVDLARVGWIVNLCEYSVDDLLPPNWQGTLANWYVRDPYGASLDSYRKTRDALTWLVTEQVPELTGCGGNGSRMGR